MVNDSSPTVLLSSDKLQSKVMDICKEGLHHTPVVGTVKDGQAHTVRVKNDNPVLKDHPRMDQGGMMLYTSGTTSRPVWMASFAKGYR